MGVGVGLLRAGQGAGQPLGVLGSASKRMRARRRTMSREGLVVIRCSQPSKVPGEKSASERNTRTNVSTCVRVLGVLRVPGQAVADRYTRAEWSRTTCSHVGATSPRGRGGRRARTPSGSQTGAAVTPPGVDGVDGRGSLRDARRDQRTGARTVFPIGQAPSHIGSPPVAAATAPRPRRARIRAGVPRPLPSVSDDRTAPPSGGGAEGAAYADRFAMESPEMAAARTAPSTCPARLRSSRPWVRCSRCSPPDPPPVRSCRSAAAVVSSGCGCCAACGPTAS